MTSETSRWAKLLPALAFAGPIVFGAGGLVVGNHGNQAAIVDLRTDMNRSLEEIKKAVTALSDQRVASLEVRVSANEARAAASLAWQVGHEKEANARMDQIRREWDRARR